VHTNTLAHTIHACCAQSSSTFRDSSRGEWSARLCLVSLWKRCWVSPFCLSFSLSLSLSLSFPLSFSHPGIRQSLRFLEGARGRNTSDTCPEETLQQYSGKKSEREAERSYTIVGAISLARHGSSVLRDYRDRVPGVCWSCSPGRRPGLAESPTDRGTLRAEPVILRMRAEGHLTAHAQDSRRVDVGGKRTRIPLSLFLVLTSRECPSRSTASPVPRNMDSRLEETARYSGSTLRKKLVNFNKYLVQYCQLNIYLQ